jgi:Myb-like DNA-binding domain
VFLCPVLRAAASCCKDTLKQACFWRGTANAREVYASTAPPSHACCTAVFVCHSVKKEPWSEAEDRIILVCQSEHGNKWAEISKKLPGRYIATTVPLLSRCSTVAALHYCCSTVHAALAALLLLLSVCCCERMLQLLLLKSSAICCYFGYSNGHCKTCVACSEHVLLRAPLLALCIHTAGLTTPSRTTGTQA